MTKNNRSQKNELGQSLVEIAIVTPVLIILIAGLVEVTQLAVTSNRIRTAARNAARYGANGGEDVGLRDVALATVTDTLDLSSGVWDIWSIRAAVEDDGSIQAGNFDFEHIYGDGQTQDYAATNTASFQNQLRLRVQDDLRKDGSDNSVDDLGAGLDVVGVYILHDIEAMIGLNILPNLAGIKTIDGYSVMRRASLAASVVQTAGCRGVFPIIIERNVNTITQSEYETIVFTYPVISPAWESFSHQTPTATPLGAGQEGYIYKLNLGTGAQNFNWLKWNTTINTINPPPANHSILAASLSWPGNSGDFADKGDPPGGGTFRGFEDVLDASDHELQQGDFVAQDTISGGFAGMGVASELQDHIDKNRAIRLLLWDNPSGGYSNSPVNNFEITGFGVFRPLGYGSDWLLLELVRLDNSCGQNR